MDKLERQSILKELNKLSKDLLSYKKRQEKHISVKFTNGQMNQLDNLRSRIRFNYRGLKKNINEYGGTDSIKIAGIQYDVFEYSLRKQSLNLPSPELFTALDKAINIVGNTIKGTESIPITTTDWRDIKVTRPKEEVKEITPISIPVQLHPRILEVSQSLFETGHYSQAILEAFKAVNNFVKEKTGLSLDGRDLMTKVFRKDDPVIKLNELKTISDKDEQEGFMFLFMGSIVGIRNPKAHDRVVQLDPHRTLEYLGFASLLMRRIEEGRLQK